MSSGEIPIESLNEAVYRILLAKKYLGLFDGRKPHEHNKNHIRDKSHVELARTSVRESIVLLKNNDVLPMNPGKNFLIIGEQSKYIENQMGGWTITWQGKSWEGTNISNNDFPNTKSIYESLSSHIKNMGGRVEYSNDGSYKSKPDFAIMVYGETPYAEGFGDIKDLDFSKTNKQNLKIMSKFLNEDIQVLSLFITGRPLIVDQEIELSDAFVSIWLPGTAVEGINDVIFSNIDSSINYDFSGKLPYSWPNANSKNPLNLKDKDNQPRFEYGYGLSYESNENE